MVFVRHAIPDEVVRLRITQVTSKFARGDVTEVLRASPHRRMPPCPIAGRCGGCDFQHIDVDHQRELKRRVVAELLWHLAGVTFNREVEAVEPPDLGWRTRMRYHTDAEGRPGLRAHRSLDVVPLPVGGCRVARPEIARPRTPDAPDSEVLAAVSASEVIIGGREVASMVVTERAAGRPFQVAADGFWQSHTQAPEVLAGAVLGGLSPQPEEVALDLYCGVGLFAGALVDAGCRVWGVEGSRRAVGLARTNVPEARFVAGDVARSLRRLPDRADLIVLDPPRTGAGRDVIAAIATRGARAIAYVACDPAALGRDLRAAQDVGLAVGSVRAFDLFPMTHHVETVAILVPS